MLVFCVMIAIKPKITVAAIAENNGRFLMIEEYVRGRLVISQPAGHWEPHESLTDAVIRETLEESGYTFAPDALCGIYFWQHPETTATVVRVNFVGTVTGHDPALTLDEGIVRFLWLDRQQLVAAQSRLRNPMVLRAVDDYLANKRYPLDILHHVEDDWRLKHSTG